MESGWPKRGSSRLAVSRDTVVLALCLSPGCGGWEALAQLFESGLALLTQCLSVYQLPLFAFCSAHRGIP
jgi:hypothetical protein